MGKVIWHTSAYHHLHEIFSYHYECYSPKVAYSLLKEMLSVVQVLESSPRAAALEPLLRHRKKEYRYLLVRRRYKIEYYISHNDECHIFAVWDCKRNPNTFETISLS